jgi:Transposase
MPVTSKHLPGRPKTDTLDAVWLCKLAERQMLRPSFVPPRPIRQLRDLTRYRADLVAARTAETQRVEQLLEDAQINLSVVASDIFGVSGRAMLAALLAGERDPKVPSPAGPDPPARQTGPVGAGRAPDSSPTSTPSCSPRCWPEWTHWTPTWPTSTPSLPS